MHDQPAAASHSSESPNNCTPDLGHFCYFEMLQIFGGSFLRGPTYYAPPAFHQDSRVQAACAVTAEAAEGVQLNSIPLAGADAGILLHEVGGLGFGYGSRDVVLFNGAHFHGPLPPCPRKSIEDKSKVEGKKGKPRAHRRSYVTFFCE